jgi:poly [ADP-ribose] polymerase
MPPKKKAAAAVSASVFDGLTMCISGDFSVSQSEIKSLLTDNGATLAGTVTKAVTHLVSNTLGSAKTQSAEDKGLPIVTEDWVNASIKNGTLSTKAAQFLSGKPSGNSNSNAAPKTQKVTGNKRKVKAAAADEDEEEEEEEKKKPAAKGKGKKAAVVLKSADNDDEEEEADPAPKKPKSSYKSDPADIRTIVVKGKAPVDDQCTISSSVHVYTEGEEAWDACLNQTNIGNNNNKFYYIQLLESDTSKQYWVWTRWVGTIYTISVQLSAVSALKLTKSIEFC